jgi:hypothetical protein
MKIRIGLLFIILFIVEPHLHAQRLAVFNLSWRELNKNGGATFTSLSDVYELSDHPDSLAVPDLEAIGFEGSKYFRLDSNYRERFLYKTKIAETDSLFIYDYAGDALITISVKNLDLVASLSIYESASDWPYSQYDYQIGFEINKNLLNGFHKYYSRILVCVGQTNPFVRGQMRPVHWEKMKSGDFPSMTLGIDNWYRTVEYVAGDVFQFKADGFHYFVQDLKLSNGIAGRRLVVIETQTNKSVCERYYYESESASMVPLNFVEPENENTIFQWTGRLFVNKPAVIFWFQYHTFGCPGITVLNQSELDIPINCDNRH